MYKGTDAINETRTALKIPEKLLVALKETTWGLMLIIEGVDANVNIYIVQDYDDEKVADQLIHKSHSFIFYVNI